MQTSNQIKHFTCQLHPSETIQRVCLDPNAESSLRCIECILNGSEKVSKDSMIALNEFIDNAAQQYQTFKRISAFETAPPEELIEFLTQEDENIEKLSQHVEKEKERVNASFNTMIQEFTQLCHRKKNEITTQLDKQLATLKFNYSYYKSKLDKYCKLQREDSLNPDKETLISRINECQETDQVEVLIKNIKDDLLEASSREDPEQKTLQIKESLSYLAQKLQDQAKSLPNTKFCDQAAIDASLNDFRETIDSLIEDFVEIDSQIFELSWTDHLSIDSNLIEKQEHLNLLKKWLAPSHKDFQLRLLYRGTRDGLTYGTFHQKCDDHDTTLTIAKSNLGRIFGGYTDQKWNDTNNYKTSKDSWLFSIDEKLKFPIMEAGYSSAIYSTAEYGPTFGSGHDLLIDLTSGGPHQSYSQLGSTYQMNCHFKPSKKIKGDGSLNETILGGSYQFMVVELEIYSVEKKNNFISELDSQIINPKQDLNLIKSWLGREKNHKFELIYRGTRDGFRAEDFHRNCDRQGPTLIICKSKDLEQVFGGFTSKNWSKDEAYIEDQEAFLFSLTHSSKHPVIDKDKAIYSSAAFGPVFGTGHDLYIHTESNVIGNSNSCLGISYQVSESVEQKQSYLAGDKNFLLDEIEVFTVKSN